MRVGPYGSRKRYAPQNASKRLKFSRLLAIIYQLVPTLFILELGVERLFLGLMVGEQQVDEG